MTNITSKINYVRNSYLRCFADNNYILNDSVKISSGIDSSVSFIGSGISVFKPKILNQTISKNGEFIKQKSIRCQSLKNIFDISIINEYYSFFEALCVLRRYEDLNILIKDMMNYLNNYLGLNNDEILFRINSKDSDLIMSLCDNNLNDRMEIDSRTENYYFHKYGLDEFGIYGRNFNIAILDKTDKKFKDIGNVISIESNNKKYACEFATGIQPLVMRKEGIPLSINASYISDVFKIDTPEKNKLAECIVVVSNLLVEDISKNKKRYPIYLYKKYYRALKYWAEFLNYNEDIINYIINEYLKLEYNLEENPKITKLKL